MPQNTKKSSINHTLSSTPVHSIELTVQSLIESPLEVLSLNLNSLYESQMILSTILQKLENTLNHTVNNIHPQEVFEEEEGDTIKVSYTDFDEQVDLDNYLRRIEKVKCVIKQVTIILDKVEVRVDRIGKNLDVEL